MTWYRRLVPALIMLVGVAVAGVCTWLGLWQAQVFDSQGMKAREAATQAPPVTLDTQTGKVLTGLWGRTVIVTGTYQTAGEVLVQDADGTVRVVTPLVLGDGRVVAVVRGHLPSVPPPTGVVTQRGVLLPPEEGRDHAVIAGRLSSVRLQQLAQAWPQPVVDGYVTLSAADASAQGMAPVAVVLPKGAGEDRNAGYALQWWVFGAFALVMSGAVARSYHRRGFQLADEPGA
jgi:cytochrome oxidase assembly protein ShyY1